MDNNNNNINKNNNNNNRSQATTTTSSSTDFILQWGNRKRLRCMKQQQQQQQLTKDEKLPLGQRSITARGDRRNKDSLSNGGFNLRQRSSSPAHRVLRNCESTTIGMKGGHQSNGDNKRNNNHKNSNNSGNGSGGSSETGAKSSSGNEMMVWPPKFAIGLTNKEKEEDFLAIKGSKLPQRPKKRAKFIQRTINLVCPGGWLCDLTLERYEVREKKITKKRPRGLKAMGSIESESE